jgi:hypothetical protein
VEQRAAAEATRSEDGVRREGANYWEARAAAARAWPDVQYKHSVYKHAQYVQKSKHLLPNPVLPNTPHAQRRRVLGPHLRARRVRRCFRVHLVPAASVSLSVPPRSASRRSHRSQNGLRTSSLRAPFPPSRRRALRSSSRRRRPFRAMRAERVRVPTRSPVLNHRCPMYGPHRCAPRCRGCRLRISVRPRGLRIRARLLLRDSKDRSYGSDSGSTSSRGRRRLVSGHGRGRQASRCRSSCRAFRELPGARAERRAQVRAVCVHRAIGRVCVGSRASRRRSAACCLASCPHR